MKIKLTATQANYAQKRQQLYPSTEQQLEMLWDAMDKGEIPKATEFYDRIKLVKQLVPKGSTKKFTKVELKVGEKYDLKAGQKFYAVRGTAGDITGPMLYTPTNDITITASTPLFGYLIA